MIASLQAAPSEDKGDIPPFRVKKEGEVFDPETFFAKAGLSRMVVNLREKDTVFSQGDQGNCVYYIQKGRVKLVVVSPSGKEGIIALLGAGEFIGEECILSPHRVRTATAAALVDCAVLRIGREEILRVLQTEHAFSDLLVSCLLARNIRFEADLVDQLFNSIEKRLARVLLLMSQFGKTGKPETMIPNVSQETLAGMVGATRSRVSQCMNRFRKLGLIAYRGSDPMQVYDSLLNIVLQD